MGHPRKPSDIVRQSEPWVPARGHPFNSNLRAQQPDSKSHDQRVSPDSRPVL